MGRTEHDRIKLAGLRICPRIGVTPGERRMPQPCDVDLEVWGDFEAAASTDALAKAIDYSRLADRTLETAHSREYNLIETLAYAVARAVLSGFPASRVRVRVRKRPASLCEKLDYVEAEVTES